MAAAYTAVQAQILEDEIQRRGTAECTHFVELLLSGVAATRTASRPPRPSPAVALRRPSSPPSAWHSPAQPRRSQRVAASGVKRGRYDEEEADSEEEEPHHDHSGGRPWEMHVPLEPAALQRAAEQQAIITQARVAEGPAESQVSQARRVAAPHPSTFEAAALELH